MVNLCSSVTADSVNPSNGCGVGGRNDADLVNDKMIDQKTHEELRKLNPRDLTDDQLTTASLVGGVDFAALVESLRRSKISNDRSSKKNGLVICRHDCSGSRSSSRGDHSTFSVAVG